MAQALAPLLGVERVRATLVRIALDLRPPRTRARNAKAAIRHAKRGVRAAFARLMRRFAFGRAGARRSAPLTQADATRAAGGDGTPNLARPAPQATAPP